MKALLFLLVAGSSLLPIRWVALALPAIWILQRLLPPELGTLIQIGALALSPADLIIMLLAAKTLGALILQKELVLDRTLYFALGGYLVVNLVASLAAGWKFDQGQFVRCVTSWVRFLSELIVLPVIAQSVRTLPQLKFGVRLLLGTLAGVAVIQFINYAGASHGIVIGEVQGAERGEWRYFGPVGDSVGVVLLLGYLAALCYGNPIAIALFLGGIVLTAGVGAIVATAFGTGLFLLLGTRTATVRAAARRHAWLLPLIVLGAVLSLAGFAQPMAKTFLKRFSSGSYASSGTQRSASLRMAGRMIVDNPVLGVGYMGYERVLEKYGGEEYFDLAHPDGATANANNQIAQSLADAGVLGLVALLGVVFAAGRLLLRVARCEDQFVSTFFLAAFLWLLAQLLGNLAAVWLNPSAFVARLLWVTLGLAVAARRILPATGPQPATHKTEPFATPLLPA
jgi:hypothetical protein